MPALSFLEIGLVGRLIVVEIVLLALLPWLWLARDRPPLPRWVVVLWAGWLVSQIVTDIVVGSAFSDYARGWAGITFTLTNFAAILILASTPKRARLFALGLAVAGFLGYIFVPQVNAADDPWKWAWALPVGLVLAASLSGHRASRFWWMSILAFVAFGVGNLVLGFRSLGGVSLVVAGYLALAAVVDLRQAAMRHSRRRAVIGLVFVVVAGVSVLGLYSTAASQGLLGPEARARYFAQAGAFGALLGARTESLASTQAIVDSPILGHGSWAKDPQYAILLAERLESLGYEVPPEYVGAELIPAHSYLLGSWVWAGFLGAVFWFGVAAIAAWLLANLYAFRVETAPLLVFSTVLFLWNIAFSPYGHAGRITAAFSIALCLLGFHLIRERSVEHLSSDGVSRSGQRRRFGSKPSHDPPSTNRPRATRGRRTAHGHTAGNP